MIRLAIILLIVHALGVAVSSTKAADKKSPLSINSTSVAALNSQCSQILCSELNYNCFGIYCSPNGPTLLYGYCATFNEDTKLLSITKCRYFEPKGYNVTSSKQILLPRNLSLLNNYMCGPLNRKGLVCSECADGFGPSLTSFRYTKCINCTQSDAKYGVPLFLFIMFVPITVFYFVVLIFQIKIFSAPMPCFILYAQFVVLVFDSAEDHSASFIKSWNHTLYIKIILTFYGIFNLYFGHHINILPQYCLNKHLKFIHLAILGYVSAFYPMLLILLTWVCVELHGHNFRLLVWLWRPFHRCFVRLRRGWNTKSDIIDAFATFFLLSYNRILYQTILLIGDRTVKHYNESGSYFITYRSQIDMSISYRSAHQLLLEVVVIGIASIFIILPPLLLVLYPVKRFRSCLSKCRINFITIHIFTDKVYSCYRDGLDGGRDMRSFSGLYFFVRIAAYICTLFSHLTKSFLHANNWLTIGTLLFFITLTIAIAKPYRRAYMNHLDIAILSNLALLFYALSSGTHALLLAKILLSIPIIVFVLTIVWRKFYNKSKVKLMQKNCCNCFGHRGDAEANRRFTTDSPTDTEQEEEPLIQPKSTTMISNYGAKTNEAT